MNASTPALPPLYVDLDGTLVATDTLWEALISIARYNPAALRKVLPLIFHKTAFKAAVSRESCLLAADLPYREALLGHLRKEHARGRKIILATASHENIAQAVAEHLGFFDGVLATNSERNLLGAVKRDAIMSHAHGPFEYIGDHVVDVPVWQAATTAHGVFKKGKDWDKRIPEGQRGQIFETAGGRHRDLLKAMRPWQWSKNVLIFLPLLLSHTFLQPDKLFLAVIAFFSFSFSASSIYLINDIFDIHADRHHPKKRLRPFASGAYPIPHGFAWAILLGIVALSLGSLISWTYVGILLGYIVMTCFYTLWLKKVPVIDLVLIGFFYTYRIVAGGSATDTILTDWLVAFSTFFFLSVGIVKRYGELLLTTAAGTVEKNNRGYVTADLPVLLGFGINSSFLSILILALYIRSTEVTKLYAHPTLLWGVVVALLVWIMRLWILVQRGIIHDDPLLFTLRDRKSALLAALVAILLVIATF